MGFTMKRSLTAEIVEIVLVPEKQVADVQALITSCESCSPLSNLPLDYLLDELTNSDPTSTEYLMIRIPRCPVCSSPMNEKTLVAVV